MDKKQEAQWLEAQRISIGEDLVLASQRQLEFLSAVDRLRWLYDSPGLERAIYRYKACWLPLLAKYTENGDLQEPLVVPIDCEWIWHCHRLNPVQYKNDCERVYGKILDSKNVESSIRAKSKRKSEEMWAQFNPDEPFELDSSTISSQKIVDVNAGAAGNITYDLVSAANRQCSFYYQVSRPFTRDPLFLTEALARYKGFLHLIKTNQDKSLKRFCVPTYDVDIMWHSHQLSPVSYCNDLMSLFGKVLEHDDTDLDRSKGKKLDTSFKETTKQFEDTFGLRYWRAGVMYRGTIPTPLTVVPVSFSRSEQRGISPKHRQDFLSLPSTKVVEVFLEIVDVKDAAVNESETLYVSFTKKQPDMIFSECGTLSILSLTGDKNVAGFECEPSGDLILTLMAKSNANSNSERDLGTTSISLDELTDPNSKLSIERWLQLKSKHWIVNSTPVYLRVAASCLMPSEAPRVFNIGGSLYGKETNVNYWTNFIDGYGNEAVRVQMRDNIQKDNLHSKREVVGVTELFRRTTVLAEGIDNKWSFSESCNFSGTAEIKTSQDGTYICELKSDQMIKIYWGKRLDFEQKCCKGHNEYGAFITAVEFSNEYPYGKAIALLDMKSKLIKVNEEWFLLPWITLSFIFMEIFEKDIKSTQSLEKGTMKGSITMDNLKTAGGHCSGGCSGGCGSITLTASESVPLKTAGGHCSGGCSGGCGSITLTANESVPLKTAGGHCSGGCSGGCGSITLTASESVPLKTAGGHCSGGCSGGCGSITLTASESVPLKTAGGHCSGGCSGGCGSITLTASESVPLKTAGGHCSGGCSGGCGSITLTASESVPLKTAGGHCSGGCSGGCGSITLTASESVPLKTAGGHCSGGCSGGCGNHVGSREEATA